MNPASIGAWLLFALIASTMPLAGCGHKNDRVVLTGESIARQVRQAVSEADVALAARCKAAFDEYVNAEKPTVCSALVRTKDGWKLDVQWFANEPDADTIAVTFDGTTWQRLPMSETDVKGNRDDAAAYVQYGALALLTGAVAELLDPRLKADPGSVQYTVRVQAGERLVAEAAAVGVFMSSSYAEQPAAKP